MTDLDKLKQMTAWDTEPCLTEGELTEALQGSIIEESRYDLNAAASQAWLIKAARMAGVVESNPDSESGFTSKVFENCRAMARIYAAKRHMNVS